MVVSFMNDMVIHSTLYNCNKPPCYYVDVYAHQLTVIALFWFLC